MTVGQQNNHIRHAFKWLIQALLHRRKMNLFWRRLGHHGASIAAVLRTFAH
jgi:hypothetical protein